MGLRPCARFGRTIDEIADEFGISGRERGICEEETGIVGKNVAAVSQHSRLRTGLPKGEIGIPHDPCVDAATLESKGSVGGAQVDGRDVANRQPVLLQSGCYEVVRTRALGIADLLALQIGYGVDRRAVLYQDALALRSRRLPGEVDDLPSGRLHEDATDISGIAEADAADVHGLEQIQPRCELDPVDRDAFFLETPLEDLELTRDQRD